MTSMPPKQALPLAAPTTAAPLLITPHNFPQLTLNAP